MSYPSRGQSIVSRGMLPSDRFNAVSQAHALGIGERDYADYCTTLTYFNYFGDSAPIYIKTNVWKGINTSLKLDLIEDLREAIKGTLLYRRDRAASRLYVCALDMGSIGNPEVIHTLAYIYIKRSQSVTVMFYTNNIISTEKYFQDELLPRLNKIIEPYTSQPEDSHTVNISFSIHSMDGANISSRQIQCPTWNEIKENYPYNHEEIDRLFTVDDPDKYGKFVFWHGPPGTGKSYLIRAALQRWKMNVRCMYIVDPENFFNNANYMQEVLLHRPSDADDDDDSYMWYDDEDYRESPEGSKFRLLIIEDGLNNMLTETRHDKEGAVSRFLNLTDGILGQGLRLVFIVTSNEKVNEIDPAFLRKGRCLQELEFPEFEEGTAKEWLKNKKSKVTLPVKKVPKYSLADMYAYINADDPMISKRVTDKKVGFRF